MGLHNLPPSYDTWRTATPWDAEDRRHRSSPDTIDESLLIEAGEITIDAVGEYDTNTCALVTVRINGADFAPHQVAAMLALFAPRHTGAWDADMDSDEMGNRLGEIAEDYESDRADYQRGLRDDD